VIALWLAERDGDGLARASAAALEFALALAAGPDDVVIAALFGPDDIPAEIVASDVGRVCHVQSAQLAGYAPAGWASALRQLAGQHQASAVIAAATDRGNEVMAHLAAMTDLPLAAGCVSASPAGPERWHLVRQRWAGSVLEEAELSAPVALLTVAADAWPGTPSGTDTGRAAPAVEVFTPEFEPSELAVRASESAAVSAGESLATARVVVGGGRGVGGPEGFAALEELAGLLGGVVGVSRVVTSNGWRPHRQQVGQTGTRISPELYLACGISGAIQHMAGCLTARHIIVINTDQNAPIISRAEYAVIADLHELIPALIAAIRER
jgi:electron transfer flavoprotein alpha subunit